MNVLSFEIWLWLQLLDEKLSFAAQSVHMQFEKDNAILKGWIQTRLFPMHLKIHSSSLLVESPPLSTLRNTCQTIIECICCQCLRFFVEFLKFAGKFRHNTPKIRGLGIVYETRQSGNKEVCTEAPDDCQRLFLTWKYVKHLSGTRTPNHVLGKLSFVLVEIV
jgi:hypothetical protein